MRSVVLNHSSEGESLSSQGVAKPHLGMVEAALLARLEDEEAPLDMISVQVLGLSVMGYNALKNANITTIRQLIDCTENNLLSIRNIGVTTLGDIRNKLNSYIETMLQFIHFKPLRASIPP